LEFKYKKREIESVQSSKINKSNDCSSFSFNEQFDDELDDVVLRFTFICSVIDTREQGTTTNLFSRLVFSYHDMPIQQENSQTFSKDSIERFASKCFC